MGKWIRDAGGRLTGAMRPEDGATAVEYALMVALIALVVVAAVTFLGQGTNSLYGNSSLVNSLGS